MSIPELIHGPRPDPQSAVMTCTRSSAFLHRQTVLPRYRQDHHNDKIAFLSGRAVDRNVAVSRVVEPERGLLSIKGAGAAGTCR
jgi:hypothetical protein